MPYTNLSRHLARSLAIDLDHRDREEPRAELQSAARSLEVIGSYYVETEPSAADWVAGFRPTWVAVRQYVKSLFPFLSWISYYNQTWLIGDLVAGVTVGFVVIPQGMAYALLAQLPAEYGLYTSFVGFLIYWAFATSKDITIGTVAVMSQLVGNVVIRVRDEHPDWSATDIAQSLSIVAGAVLLFIGLVRIGWVVELIPLVAITSFMTGAAINIAAGQVPALLGIKNVSTRGATYRTIIDTLAALPSAGLDAAIGMTSLVWLYGIRMLCNWLSERQPQRKKLWFFVSTLRMAFVILLYILISFLINRHVTNPQDARIKILGDVPSGFRDAGAPDINTEMIAAVVPDLPVTIIVLIIEHIAISKSFGRINNYVIDPSQELVALGLTNLIGPFLGAYPATGSFSRTAIKSKAGVRTPLAGLFTAAIVLLALYVLTRMFYYIPMASLAGLIIHAVGDLISPPAVVYRFWELSPFEVIIFFGGVILTIFTSIEIGIYFTIAASAALLLWRLARAQGVFLGKVELYRVGTVGTAGGTGKMGSTGPGRPARETFLPLDHRDGSNPDIDVRSPYPGVFVYRFGEGLNYLNQAHYLETAVHHIIKETKRTKTDSFEKLGDRPWNDPGPRRGQPYVQPDDERPILRAVILDMSPVNYLDVTSVQGLIDARNQLDRHAAPSPVEWHFASVTNRWSRRALAVAGFGFPTGAERLGKWKPIFSIAAVGDASLDPQEMERLEEEDEEAEIVRKATDEETAGQNDRSERSMSVDEPRNDKTTGKGWEAAADRNSGENSSSMARTRLSKAGDGGRFVAIQGMDRPFFHIDVAAAVESAVENVRG